MGSIIRTGRRARKSSAGYDLTRLFVGLGRYARHHHGSDAPPLRQPEAMLGRWSAPSRRGRRVAAVTDGHPVRHPGRPRRIPRRRAIAPPTAIPGSSLPETPTLFFELHGSPRRGGGAGQDWSRRRQRTWRRPTSTGRPTRRSAARLWRARHNIHYAHAGHAAERADLEHRCLRADLAARAAHHRDAAGY